MSAAITKAKRSAARLIRRIGRSRVGMMLPQSVKRRGVDLAKVVLGDATLQARVPQKSGIEVRRLGLTVSFDGAASASFASERVVRVDPSVESWAGLTHLDAVVTTGISNAERREQIDRLRPCIVHPRRVVPPVPDQLTPLGFDLDAHEHFVTLLDTGPALSAAARAAVPPGRTVETLAVSSVPDPLDRPDKWSRSLQPYAGLIDHAAHWADPLGRATTLARVAAVGVPVVLADRPDERFELAGLLPPAVFEAFAATEAFDLVDPARRDHIAFRQWSAVHQHMSARAVWDRELVDAGRPGLPSPTVSVIVATNRPEMIDNWAPQIAAQLGVEHECVAVLHGAGFTDADEGRIRGHLGDHATVLRAPSTHVLGDLLRAATRVAGGDLVVKWDDDDLYSRGHVADLVRAREYSGATVVGKACEYVYLAGPRVTVRRDQGRRETFSATLAGGTLCIARGDLAAVGGWRRTPRRVDSLLIEDVLSAGGLAYRAIGFGYVMLRAGSIGHSHTWDVADAHFLDPRFEQRRGLDTGFAGIDMVPEVLERWR